MGLLKRLTRIWSDTDSPFLLYGANEISFSQIVAKDSGDLSLIRKGDVVAIIGDFNPISILRVFILIDMGAIIVPLTIDTEPEHEYFFESALVDIVIKGDSITRRKHGRKCHIIETLKEKNHAGLVFFSTGTTGPPKAILHDSTLFFKRFETPRPTYRTLSFLLFDHLGGLNTLFHTLFNKGVVVAPTSRTVDGILTDCEKYKVEVLPATPTFLRLMLMSGTVPDKISSHLKIISYGTEAMDQSTLSDLCKLLPRIDFRQTFGVSELGVIRAKSESRNSLFMKLGGEGVEVRVIDDILQIRSQFRMLGYLNAPTPFDIEGWYNTKDVVEQKNGYFKVTGRISDVINVGGLKFMASDVERKALDYPNVSLVKVTSKQNPITGQHVELLVEPTNRALFDKDIMIDYLKSNLPPHMVPKRVRIGKIGVGHRFKKT